MTSRLLPPSDYVWKKEMPYNYALDSIEKRYGSSFVKNSMEN